MRNVVYNGSREIYANMVSAAKSLLTHTKVDKVFFLIEDDIFPFPLPPVIETRNVRGLIRDHFKPGGPNYGSRWTPLGLARWMLTKIFPDLDQILAIDADTIVMQDVGELFELPIDGYYFAGAREPVLTQNKGYLYINAGVMLCNLRKLRDDKKDAEIISALNNRHFFFVGQDAMNELCRGHILAISSEYNACGFTEATSNKKILHFAGDRKWVDGELATRYRTMPWPD